MGHAAILLISLISCLLAPRASAQPAPEVTKRADELFEAGKASMAAGEIGPACEMLSESYRLAPGTGGLLALAMCHEQEGKLASAFREYAFLVNNPYAQTRPDRLLAARERMSALEARLSRLTIVVADQPGGVQPEVRLDGQIVSAEELSKALPIDGGAHKLTATAPSGRTFTTDLTIAESGRSVVAHVPALGMPVDLSRIPIVRPTNAPRPKIPVAPHPAAQLHARDWVGVGALTAGLVTFGAGGLMTLRSVHAKNVADSGCDRQGCVDDPEEQPLRLDAAEKVTLAVGAALTITGTSLLLLRLTPRRERVPVTAWAAPWGTPGGAGGAVRGRF